MLRQGAQRNAPAPVGSSSALRAWRQQMGWTHVEAADKLGYMMIVNMIRAAALPGRESARLIQQIRSELAYA